MRILIAAGGTGGHVYPALAVAAALPELHPQVELHFAGSGGLEDELVTRANLPFAARHAIAAGPVAGVSWPRRFLSLLRLSVGLLMALWLLLRRRPRSVLLTGGWSNLPVALAAWLLRVPSLMYLPDIEPGAAIRLLRRFVSRVALTAPESGRWFPDVSTVVTGYPLRQEFMAATRAAGQAHFGLDPQRRTLLVFGGSRGARSINRATLSILPSLLAEGIQVLHVSGELDWPEVEARRAGLPDAASWQAYPYLHHEMGLAQAAADLALSRAGASVLAEFPHAGLPAVLVPYPWAWRYQKTNADWLEARGAALTLEDAAMETRLLPTLLALFRDEDRLRRMRRATAALARPDGARKLAGELLALGGHDA
ncbi:MAG: UDP-N-acetylglucosamine--N-acetylmuramyl-(pentapeptide) pyrophosphoryl-undecaprenol N-acetylglucosamine transferase [Anaerolineaceae bacterium]|nr:UDP-N-acetylglucosamine--N-acetylmuramyl-(pentapeptide) pyrophosphoryl-undecaprenol N-acetylglucosamine transferase [Anaerolineaceae bacterium]